MWLSDPETPAIFYFFQILLIQSCLPSVMNQFKTGHMTHPLQLMILWNENIFDFLNLILLQDASLSYNYWSKYHYFLWSKPICCFQLWRGSQKSLISTFMASQSLVGWCISSDQQWWCCRFCPTCCLIGWNFNLLLYQLGVKRYWLDLCHYWSTYNWLFWKWNIKYDLLGKVRYTGCIKMK